MPEQPKNRPSPQEAVDKAKAAAAPKIAKAMETAGPAVEKAAAGAGRFLSTLRDRAKETAKGFSDGYGAGDDDRAAAPGPGESTAGPAAGPVVGPAAEAAGAPPDIDAPPSPDRPRPRPRPGPR